MGGGKVGCCCGSVSMCDRCDRDAQRDLLTCPRRAPLEFPPSLCHPWASRLVEVSVACRWRSLVGLGCRFTSDRVARLLALLGLTSTTGDRWHGPYATHPASLGSPRRFSAPAHVETAPVEGDLRVQWRRETPCGGTRLMRNRFRLPRWSCGGRHSEVEDKMPCSAR